LFKGEFIRDFDELSTGGEKFCKTVDLLKSLLKTFGINQNLQQLTTGLCKFRTHFVNKSLPFISSHSL